MCAYPLFAQWYCVCTGVRGQSVVSPEPSGFAAVALARSSSLSAPPQAQAGKCFVSFAADVAFYLVKLCVCRDLTGLHRDGNDARSWGLA